jgi:hypothetical protein
VPEGRGVAVRDLYGEMVDFFCLDDIIRTLLYSVSYIF